MSSQGDVSTLAAVIADPNRVDNIPTEELPDILADIERLRVRVWTRLNSPPVRPESPNESDSESSDRLLDADGVAEVLNVTERYVYDHADEWPFTRRISRRKLRFSKRGLYRWLETRR